MRDIKLARQRKATATFRAFGQTSSRTSGNAGGEGYAEYSYNFDCGDGALTRGFGLYDRYMGIPGTAVNLYFYRRKDEFFGSDDLILVRLKTGEMYSVPVGGGRFKYIEGLTFSQAPVGVNYNFNGEDVFILSSPDDGMFIFDGDNAVKVEDAPAITSACVHYERLFATSDQTIWFSDDFDPSNWSVSLTEAGFIDLTGFRGDCLKVVSFLDYLYVFRRYGITKINAYAKQSDFSANDLFVSSGRTIGSSITFCGDEIIFMTSEGFYSFNGMTARRILTSLDGAIDYDDEDVKGQFYSGKAFFTVTALNDGVPEKMVLVVDVNSGNYYFMQGFDIVDIQLIDGLYNYNLAFLDSDGDTVYLLDKSGEKKGVLPEACWSSKLTDFGVTGRNKIIDEVSFYTTAKAEIIVSNGYWERKFSVNGGRRRREIFPHMIGDSFKIKIICKEASPRIEKLSVRFSYYP